MALYNLPATFFMNIVSSLSTSEVMCILIKVKVKKPRSDQKATLNEWQYYLENNGSKFILFFFSFFFFLTVRIRWTRKKCISRVR